LKQQSTTSIAKTDSGHQESAASVRSVQLKTPASHGLVQLQQLIGNQALGYFIQTKLKVSQPGDPFEQEADNVASQIMRMPDPRKQDEAAESANLPQETKHGCAKCDGHEEGEIQRSALDVSAGGPSLQVASAGQVEHSVHTKLRTGSVQASPAMAGSSASQTSRPKRRATKAAALKTSRSETRLARMCKQCEQEDEPASPDSELRVARKSRSPLSQSAPISGALDLNGRGEPLSGSVRDFFEPRFASDLSHVRIHTDAHAAGLADAIDARAFTVGQHIAFGAGEYSPQTNAGQNLLAHELTHVMQQVPYIARNGSGRPPHAHCVHGHVEGSAQRVTLSGEVAELAGETQAYVIWGTWQRGDTTRSYDDRIFPLWIQWRFGSVSADVRSRMLGILNSIGQTIFLESPPPDCQYGTLVPMATIAVLSRLGAPEEARQRREGGTAAGQREAQAGLPNPPTIAAVPPANPSAVPQSEPASPPVRGLGSEYTGGTGDRRANAPALPAQVTGPDRGTVRGISTYRMQLEYWPAGADLLSQVVEAMNWVDYHWERYDITNMVRRGLRDQAVAGQRQRARSSDAEVGRMEAAGRRTEHAVGDLGADVEHSVTDLAHPVRATHGGNAADVVERAMANYESLVLLPASAIVSLGGAALGALADLMGGTFQEREIPWPSNEGYFLIRVIAQPSPQGRNGEMQRAASVATKVVEVQRTTRIAQESLDEPEAEIAETELRLVLEQDPARRQQLETRLTDQRTMATGDALAVLRRAIVLKTAERDAATGRRRSELDREVSSLNLRLTLAEAQREEMTGTIWRPRATIASQITGETYPLLLQLGALPPEGATHRYRLTDATSPDGKSWLGRGSSPSEAAWNAALEMATHNDYGRGQLAIRLPAESPFQPKQRVLESAPRDTALVRQRLNDLVTILVILGLFVPGAGEIAAVLGAALAADRLIERWRNHTLRFDVGAVSDLIAILGAVGQGAAMLGRMRVVRAADSFILATESADMAGLNRAVGTLRAAQTAERVIQVGNEIVNYGGLVWGGLTTVDSLLEINQRELAGTLSHAEARRQRAERLMTAVRDGAIQIGQAAGVGRATGEPARSEPAVRTPEVAPGRTAERAPSEPVRPSEPARPSDPAAEHPLERAPQEPASGERRAETRDEGDLRRGAEEQRPGAAGTGDAQPAARDEHVRARATTPDGLHEIFILRDGRIFRCSRTCTEVRAHFEEFLQEQRRGTEDETRHHEIDTFLDDLTALQRRATSPDAAEINAVATETAALEMRIREWSSRIMASELSVSAGRVAVFLEILTPAELRAMQVAMGDGFTALAQHRDPQVVQRAARAFELSRYSETARTEIVNLLGLFRNRQVAARMGPALAELIRVMERFPELVNAAEISQYRAAIQANNAEQAAAALAGIRNRMVTADRTLSLANATSEEARQNPPRRLPADPNRMPHYHGRLSAAREQEIMSNPDSIHVSEGSAGRFIFWKNSEVVITEGVGGERGQIVTSYGPSGPRGDSGARIFGGQASDPGLPISQADVINGRIPRAVAPGEPPAFLPPAPTILVRGPEGRLLPPP